MNNSTNVSLGLLVLRLALGLVFMAHGAQKLFGVFGGPGMEGVMGMFGGLGIPAPEVMAWVVAVLEFGGGLLLVLGLLTKPVAALLAVNMLVAMLLVHLPAGFFLTREGPDGIEFVFSLFAACIALALAGAGAYALDSRGEERLIDRRAAVA